MKNKASIVYAERWLQVNWNLCRISTGIVVVQGGDVSHFRPELRNQGSDSLAGRNLCRIFNWNCEIRRQFGEQPRIQLRQRFQLGYSVWIIQPQNSGLTSRFPSLMAKPHNAVGLSLAISHFQPEFGVRCVTFSTGIYKEIPKLCQEKPMAWRTYGQKRNPAQ